MALVASGFFAVYELMDNGGDVMRKRVQLQAATMADAITAEGVFRPLLMLTTDMALKGYVIEQAFSEDALAFPAVGVQKEDQLLLDIQIAGKPNKTATFAIPGPKSTMFQATSGKSANIANMSAAALINLVNATQDGQQIYISDGENGQLVGTTGHRRHVKHTRG